MTHLKTFKFKFKQQSIPVGCIQATHSQYGGGGLSPSEMSCLAIAGRVSGQGYLPRGMYTRGSLLWGEAPPDYQHTLLDKEQPLPPTEFLTQVTKNICLAQLLLLPVTVLVIKMHCSLIRKLPTSHHIWVVHVQYKVL